jgi:hypothetical protein
MHPAGASFLADSVLGKDRATQMDKAREHSETRRHYICETVTGYTDQTKYNSSTHAQTYWVSEPSPSALNRRRKLVNERATPASRRAAANAT